MTPILSAEPQLIAKNDLSTRFEQPDAGENTGPTAAYHHTDLKLFPESDLAHLQVVTAVTEQRREVWSPWITN